ncbi:MAG: Crp/Fnr family transcriptional regulator [Roseiarcus sp.]
MANKERDAARIAGAAGGTTVRFRPGDALFRPGDAPKGWFAVVSGQVRVSLTSDTGREIVLYRIDPGEACLLTTSALISDGLLPAEAIAETEVEGKFLARAEFERRLEEDPAFRREVLANYADRIAELVVVMQDALFHALPERLARLLLARARDGVVRSTHQALASELGSAREVVTRTLQRFERENLVAVDRGEILLRDIAALRRLATPAP